MCPNCHRPTYFAEDGAQLPGAPPAVETEHLLEEVEKLYCETRNCVAVGSDTSAVVCCRTFLLHIAVAQEAVAGKNIVGYVEYMVERGFVPPKGRDCVDHMRTKGNEANHEIRLMKKADTEEVISFAEMLLKFIYQFPRQVSITGQAEVKPDH